MVCVPFFDLFGYIGGDKFSYPQGVTPRNRIQTNMKKLLILLAVLGLAFAPQVQASLADKIAEADAERHAAACIYRRIHRVLRRALQRHTRGRHGVACDAHGKRRLQRFRGVKAQRDHATWAHCGR